jgi:hypothetical protein
MRPSLVLLALLLALPGLALGAGPSPCMLRRTARPRSRVARLSSWGSIDWGLTLVGEQQGRQGTRINEQEAFPRLPGALP